MKRWFVALGLALLLATPIAKANDFPTRTEKSFVYNVWCRQDALYWGSIVGEDMEVRVSIGMYNGNDGKGDILHAQPQVKILNDWHYFRMRPYRDEDSVIQQAELVVISMPKKEGHTWKKLYHLTWVEFALVQNTWMVQKNGETLEFGKARKEWSAKMNWIIKMIRKEKK